MPKDILKKLHIFKDTKCHSCYQNFGLTRWEDSCSNCKKLFCSDCLIIQNDKKFCNSCVLYTCEKCQKVYRNNDLSDEEGFKLCRACRKDFLESNSKWVAGTKQEYIKGYIIVKEIGLIKIITPCSSPADVEKLLKTKSAILGANAYIKFFWDKHTENHAEDDLRLSINGNLYYKTKYNKTHYYTGHAVAVIVQKKIVK